MIQIPKRRRKAVNWLPIATEVLKFATASVVLLVAVIGLITVIAKLL